jgi:hypothetical protein
VRCNAGQPAARALRILHLSDTRLFTQQTGTPHLHRPRREVARVDCDLGVSLQQREHSVADAAANLERVWG